MKLQKTVPCRDRSEVSVTQSAATSNESTSAMTRRDAVRYLTGAGVAGLTATVLSGCGGSSGGSGSSDVTTAGTGRATLVITWPSLTKAASRLVPVAADSVVATFRLNGTLLATQTVSRPSGSTLSTLSFANLPPGTLTLSASAYPTTDGTGVADATATTTVTIVAAQSTAASITMDSTIDHLTVAPASPSVAVGSTTTLAVSAIDATGNVVLTSASTLTWASASASVATVTSAGIVTGVAAGTSVITVTETESGKSATVTATVTAAVAAHAVTPEGEIGPYFTDDSAAGYNRTSIVANIDGTSVQAGIPLVLSIYVYDTENGNLAMQGVQIDIWHCNASGVYSNESVESTLGQSWLRGYQITDANGFVTFTTIVPGWYQGRTTHIHLRVRSKYSEASSTGDGTNTTQVFFPQATVDYIDANIAPYKSEGKNNTTNVGDHVYTGETHAEMQMTLTGDYNSGYAATVAIYLPITSE